jgi:zinc D-Ala-D-Ala dipeptidase
MMIFENRNILYRLCIPVFLILTLFSCKTEHNEKKDELISKAESAVQDTIKRTDVKTEENKRFSSDDIPEKYMEIVADTLGVIVDIRYATDNNFTKKQIYDCPRCFFRKEVGEKILAIHLDLKERYGFGIKLFDCYRPSPYQYKLWEVMPDPNYVTPPKKGSIHSRGMAVDLTIVDKSGKELDMGTPFDYFGKEAHSDYVELPDQVLKNRQLLKKIMEIHGFKGIRTEWWHYSFRGLKGNVDKWIWSCE